MGRNISSPMLAPLLSKFIRPAFLAVLTFASKTEYAWTGIGDLIYAGNTYTGVGEFGKLGKITESTDVQAYGTSIALSGIDPTLRAECMADIRLGAPATIYFALLGANRNILGIPYPLFVGTVDQPSLQIGTREMSISLALENKLSNMMRASMRRYTAADQQLYYPGDTFFNWVEQLNDQALLWTT